MHGCPLETSFETAGSNLQRRALFSLGDLAEREPMTSVLRVMLNCWTALGGPKRIPREEEFLDDRIAPLFNKGHVSLIDVSDPNPWNFVILKHSSHRIPQLGKRLENTRVSDYPCPMSARALMTEYFLARQYGEPLYHEIEQVIFGYARHYTRLLLPLAGAEGSISTIFVARRCLKPPFRLDPPERG